MATFTASVSFYYGLRRFIQPTPVEHLSLAWIVLAIGLITNTYAFLLSYRRLQEEYPKQSIWKTFLYTNRIETKATFILDLTGSLAAFLGLASLILYGLTGNSQFDGLGAMVIGIVMLGLSFLLVLGVKDFLIGRGADPRITQDIKDTALKVKDVLHIVDVHTMYIGTDKLLVNMEVHIDPKLKVDEVESIIDRIKTRVRKDIPSIHHIHVELETPD
jgi:cation diffusion facilitator family transporter